MSFFLRNPVCVTRPKNYRLMHSSHSLADICAQCKMGCLLWRHSLWVADCGTNFLQSPRIKEHLKNVTVNVKWSLEFDFLICELKTRIVIFPGLLTSRSSCQRNEYRWVPDNPNMDVRNSWTIRSHIYRNCTPISAMLICPPDSKFN